MSLNESLEKLGWSPELIEAFDRARDATSLAATIDATTGVAEVGVSRAASHLALVDTTTAVASTLVTDRK